MSKKRDYSTWSKEDLIREVDALRKQKTYGLVWETDKTKEVFDYFVNWDGEKTKEVFSPETQHKFPVLKEIKGKEIVTEKDGDYNILIEGDNYHSLAVLSFTHNKSVDIIYIDPPYNTGNNDFKYNDKWVDKTDSYRHSKWLSFMEKRLKLARNLLNDAGVIFISIDDNEIAQLKILCDTIFGETNFISQIIIQSNPRGGQASRHLAEVHEYVLAYAKSADKLVIKGFSKEENLQSDYPYIDSKGRRYRLLGLRQRGGEWRREQRPNMYYPLYVNPKDETVSIEKTKTHFIESLPKRPSGEEGRWAWAPKKAINERHLLVGKKVNRKGDSDFYDIFRIDYYVDEDGNQSLAKPKTIWLDKELNYQNGRTELKEIFNGEDIFDYPKPTFLIKKLISMCDQSDSLILDFFAGSGTTAQAVLELNREDKGSRKFILCTNNEVDEKTESELKKKGVMKGSVEFEKEGICQKVCNPRIEKLVKGYTNSDGDKIDGFGGNLKYFKTDFVEADPTDKNKRKLTDKATEILCLKEGTFEPVIQKKDFGVYKGNSHLTGIIFNSDSIDDFKKTIKDLKGRFHVYVFSLGDETYEDEFKELKQKIELSPIPESILRVYRRIFE